jgi:phospholipase C
LGAFVEEISRVRHEALERLAASNPEAALSRRDFLARTASLAGMAGAASLLPASALLQHAAGAQAQGSGLPPRGKGPIDHFVILMMENRSYDHYFGWTGATGLADGIQTQTFTDASGKPVATLHHSALGDHDQGYQGCGHPDPGHGWDSGRAQLNGGFLAPGSGNDPFALTYWNEGELGFIHAAAKAYTLYDGFFCSALTSTWPNRYYKWSATAGGIKGNSPPVATLGNQWETIFDLALGSGVSAKYYNSDLPFSAVWGARGATWTHPVAEYFLDCALGTLPNITIVDPPFRDGGGFDGNSADEHPLGDVRLGQAFMSDVVNAFVSSKNYRNGALFIIYDEWGGFFDHRRPPVVADDRAGEGWGQMGFRIPAVAVSPYARNKSGQSLRVNHGTYGHESILKFIEHRFALRPLNGAVDRTKGYSENQRLKNAANIGESFDFVGAPDFDPPDLPDPAWIASRPCTVGGGPLVDDPNAAHANDLQGIEALADRFGFKIGDGKPSDIFRAPDTVRKALASAPQLPAPKLSLKR